MAEQTGGRIKVVLRWIQILDKMEPAWKEKGEFRFTARVSSENRGGVVREMKFPEEGHYDISDHPAWNKVVLNRTIFEGEIDDHLVIELGGEEVDTFTKNDVLDSYRREFRGRPKSWAGWYGPGDDVPPDEVNTADPENMSNWRICYIIEAS
jgi:hypothetical protein